MVETSRAGRRVYGRLGFRIRANLAQRSHCPLPFLCLYLKHMTKNLILTRVSTAQKIKYKKNKIQKNKIPGQKYNILKGYVRFI